MNKIADDKPKVLRNFLKSLGFGNSKWQKRACHYLLGLFSNFKRFNLQTLTESSNCFTYRQNYYFLGQAKWDENELNEKRLDFLKKDKRTKPISAGVLIIDDTSVFKYGSKTEGVFHQYAPFFR